MNGHTIDMEALDEAFQAAKDVLSQNDPEKTTLALAIETTLAVLPHILAEVDGALVDQRRATDEALEMVARGRDEMTAMAATARDHIGRVTRVFKEVCPTALAIQIVAGLEQQHDETFDERDKVIALTATQETIKRLAAAMVMSLEIDDQFQDL